MTKIYAYFYLTRDDILCQCFELFKFIITHLQLIELRNCKKVFASGYAVYGIATNSYLGALTKKSDGIGLAEA